MTTKTQSPMMSYSDWLNQYKNPDYWKYDKMPKNHASMFLPKDVDPWASYREGVPKYTKGLADYIKYAAPGLVTDEQWKQNTRDTFGIGRRSSGEIGDSLYGNLYTEDYLQSPLYKNPNTPREVLEAIYPETSAFLHNTDPKIKELLSKYDYIAPANQAQLDNAQAEGGGGLDWRSNPYGSFDLGKDNWYLTPKYMRAHNEVFGDLSRGDATRYKPYNEDGSFNPDGWEVRQMKSNALSGVMGTLGVLGAAFGSSLLGPAGGLATEITPGIEGLAVNTVPGAVGGAAGAASGSSLLDKLGVGTGNNIADKAIEGAIKGTVLSGGDLDKGLSGAISGGLGSVVNSGINAGVNAISTPTTTGANVFEDYIPDEWVSIGSGSDLDKYLGDLNTDYNDFGLGGWSPISNGSDLDLYLGTGNFADLPGTILDGISTGDGTSAGAPAADTSWNSQPGDTSTPKSSNSFLNTLQKLLTNKSGASGQAGSTNSSGMSPLMLALMMARALKGETKGAQVSRRASTGISNSAPSFNSASNRRTLYASGGHIPGMGGGQDDVVNIKAAPGEYVMDAESVSALGDGNTEEGARKLDQMRLNIRKHKRQGGLSQIPPRAKSPEQYLKGRK